MKSNTFLRLLRPRGYQVIITVYFLCLKVLSNKRIRQDCKTDHKLSTLGEPLVLGEPSYWPLPRTTQCESPNEFILFHL